MASKTILQLKGFEELLEQIQKAGGSVNSAMEKCTKQAANIMHDELKTQMKAAGVSDSLIERLPPPVVEQYGNLYVGRVGYEKGGPPDPQNLSDGYKAIFLNYGTPRRQKHGKIAARGFLEKARNKARPKIKKQQKETLDNILGELKK